MKRTRGFSVFEILIVLAVIAAIAGMSIPRLVQAFRNAEADNFVQSLLGWAERLDGARPDNVDFSGMTSPMMWALAPDNWQGTPQGPVYPVVHTYSANVTYQLFDLSGLVGGGIQFTTPMIPREVCVRIVQQLEPRFAHVHLNGVTIKSTFGSPMLHADPTSIITNCNSATNTITWTMI